MRRMLASPHPTPLEEEDEPGSEPFAGYLSNFETTRVIRSAIPAAMTVSFALRSADTTTRAFRNYCGLIEVARSVFLGGKARMERWLRFAPIAKPLWASFSVGR